jgi:hypothetical protein
VPRAGNAAALHRATGRKAEWLFIVLIRGVEYRYRGR